jgi:hypothetical protein
MGPASELLSGIRCVALLYVHIAMQQKKEYAELLSRITIC